MVLKVVMDGCRRPGVAMAKRGCVLVCCWLLWWALLPRMWCLRDVRRRMLAVVCVSRLSFGFYRPQSLGKSFEMSCDVWRWVVDQDIEGDDMITLPDYVP